MVGTLVLVVDDDADIRDAIVSVLQPRGLMVHEAANGAEAMIWLQSHLKQIPVVLLDLMMPVMDGLSFLRLKAGDPLMDGIPVVVLTAGEDRSAEARASGAWEYVRKPFSIEQLLGALARVTSRLCAFAPVRGLLGAPALSVLLRPSPACSIPQTFANEPCEAPAIDPCESGA